MFKSQPPIKIVKLITNQHTGRILVSKFTLQPFGVNTNPNRVMGTVHDEAFTKNVRFYKEDNDRVPCGDLYVREDEWEDVKEDILTALRHEIKAVKTERAEKALAIYKSACNSLEQDVVIEYI